MLVATEIIPEYQNSVFLTVEDAVAFANIVPDTPAPDKVGF